MEELGWETLEKRQWSRCVSLFYEIVNTITPPYTRSPIPNLQEHPYSLRTRTLIRQIYARTEKYKLSFYPDCLCEWENNITQVNGIHDPKRSALLTQLQVGLSALRFHKFRHNFTDTLTPLCPINDAIKDTVHFLLQCQLFHLERNSLLSRV